MANPEHFKVLKRGVRAWNRWREEYPSIKPTLNGMDLRNARLSHADLSSVNFSGANLNGAKLFGADLSFACLNGARVSHADLSHTTLTGAKLKGACLNNSKLIRTDLSHTILSHARLVGSDLNHTKFNGTNLSEADLTGVDLRNAILRDTNLNGASLRNADITGATLENVDLTDADLSGAELTAARLSIVDLKNARLIATSLHYAGIEEVNFTGVNIQETKGLDTVEHTGPSEISISTIYSSQGKIPEAFLRGCGLSDWQIETAKLYQPDLSGEEITTTLYRIHDLRASRPIQIAPLFISYSHEDNPFVDGMEGYLNEWGVRFWRDIHHATSGRLEKQIDRAIRLNPTVLLILSEHAVQSDWVQHEARLARQLEKEIKRDVLCPIALDDSWKNCDWPERLREQIMEYNILDFSEWRDEEKFRRMFNRLLKGLDLFYK